jgi:glycosyltransferase involved in cell wall biosynthesis
MSNTTEKTILHFITGLESGGGAETFLARIIPRLDEGRHAVCSMRPPGEMGDKLKKAGVRVESLNMQYKYDLTAITRYRNLLKSIQPDAQINYLIHADAAGRVFGKLFGVPKIISFIRNKHQNFTFRTLEKLTIGLADCVYTNSQAVMDYYQEHYSLPKCTAVIPNGVAMPDVSEDERRAVESELNFLDDDFVITTVARLVPQKDHKTLLKGFAEFIGQIEDTPKPTLLLCGDGPLKDDLQKLADKLSISSQVRFLGKRDDVYSILSITNVFVLPSKKEGMSNALLEAMASGCACIISDIPENTELIKDEENGLAFSLGNAQDCARQIQTLYKDTDLRKVYSQKAKENIENTYSLKETKKKFDYFIKKICQN